MEPAHSQPADAAAAADACTPPRPVPPAHPTSGEAPNAPAKTRKLPEAHQAWSEFVEGMNTMPVADAQRLKPRDISFQMGPMMTEEQFKEYQRTKNRNVRVIR